MLIFVLIKDTQWANLETMAPKGFKSSMLQWHIVTMAREWLLTRIDKACQGHPPRSIKRFPNRRKEVVAEEFQITWARWRARRGSRSRIREEDRE